MPSPSSLPILRLLQITDSSFPAGGFAYSHGLEWLAQSTLVSTEADLEALLRGYVVQSAGRQSLPAALRALRAVSVRGVLAVDRRLDASIVSPPERGSSTAMGRRILEESAATLGGERTLDLVAAVEHGEAPGHFAVAFACVARDQRVEEGPALAALGFTMIGSITQAAIRLGLIGQRAMLRLNANAIAVLDGVVEHLLSGPAPVSFGSFLPALEIATARHETLPFRMFAS